MQEQEMTITHIERFLEQSYEALLRFSVKVAAALVVLIIGILVIRMLSSFARKIIKKRNPDPTVSGFLMNVFSWLLKILLFIAVISKLGIETSSFVAVLGTMGLAVGLSLQGSLSNFSGGLLIIMFKPFRVGDYIQAQGVEGTVRQIQIFNTQINNDNNQAIFIPNGILSNGTVINFSKEQNRRSNLSITVSASNDLAKVNQLFMDIIHNNDKVLKMPAPAVVLSELVGDTATFSIRPWALRPNFSAMNSEVLLALKDTIEKEGIKLPIQSVEFINIEKET